MEHNILIRIWLIINSLLLAFIIYHLVVKPYILTPLSFINTSTALQIQYQQYGNSVLVHILPTGYWIWFDGKDIIVYGEPSGRVCKDQGYDSVYVYDVIKKKVSGYMCAKDLEEVKKLYNDKNSKIQYIFKRKFKSDFDVYDVINLLSDRRIINISK